MSTVPLLNEDRDLHTPRGHTIGFIDSITECDALTTALNEAGFPNTAISVWRDAEGVRLLERMLNGSLWGESVEEILKRGNLELRNGHAVVCIAVRDAEDAGKAASISTEHGCRCVYHFGAFVDTRLTA